MRDSHMSEILVRMDNELIERFQKEYLPKSQIFDSLAVYKQVKKQVIKNIGLVNYYNSDSDCDDNQEISSQSQSNNMNMQNK